MKLEYPEKPRYNAHLESISVRWVRAAMGKIEIILTLIILLLIIFGFWFIFSGEIWHLVEFLENSLYPTFDAP
ncbi:Ecr family regulatory small membrane protein [Enterobacter asburiae]|uniref:Ecr family regulatory small membrane protein n=1 Tax=Enterobacter asburiae TaxID=61645 RepID=UPI000797ADBC|nr:Ecr family regulatory small membrane protein [Enterobacter asburiae]SAG73354.1 Uncharacterised protein [Enterobacter cloacae]